MSSQSCLSRPNSLPLWRYSPSTLHGFEPSFPFSKCLHNMLLRNNFQPNNHRTTQPCDKCIQITHELNFPNIQYSSTKSEFSVNNISIFYLFLFINSFLAVLTLQSKQVLFALLGLRLHRNSFRICFCHRSMLFLTSAFYVFNPSNQRKRVFIKQTQTS